MTVLLDHNMCGGGTFNVSRREFSLSLKLAPDIRAPQLLKLARWVEAHAEFAWPREALASEFGFPPPPTYSLDSL